MESDSPQSIEKRPPPPLLFRNARHVQVEPGTYALRSLLNSLSRRARLMGLCFLAVFGIASLFAVLRPRQYEAEVRLLLVPDRVSATCLPGATPARRDVTDAEMAAELELFRSHDVLEPAVEQCGLASLAGADPDTQRRRLAEAARELEKDMRVAPVRKTSLIAVRYRSSDPQKAAQVANALAAAYLAKHGSLQRNDRAAEFFAAEAAKRAAQLAAARQGLADFGRRHGITGLDAEKTALNGRIADLETQLQRAELEIQEAGQRRELLRQQSQALPQTLETASRVATSSPVVDRLKERLAELETQRVSLQQKYAPGYRLVQEVEEEIQQTQRSLAREQEPVVVDRTQALNPIRQSTESEQLRTEVQIQGAKARRQSLQAALRKSRARSEELEGLTGGYERLVREVELASQRDALYRNREADLRLAQVMDQEQIDDVTIIEPAVAPSIPAGSDRTLLLLLGLMAAVSASVFAAFVAEAVDPPVRGAEDLAAISGLPVLATLSKGMGPCR